MTEGKLDLSQLPVSAKSNAELHHWSRINSMELALRPAYNYLKEKDDSQILPADNPLWLKFAGKGQLIVCSTGNESRPEDIKKGLFYASYGMLMPSKDLPNLDAVETAGAVETAASWNNAINSFRRTILGPRLFPLSEFRVCHTGASVPTDFAQVWDEWEVQGRRGPQPTLPADATKQEHDAFQAFQALREFRKKIFAHLKREFKHCST
jgi:hypothetical protein